MATNGARSEPEELEQLKATLAAQQQRIEALESKNTEPAPAPAPDKRTRRQLLKLAGASVVGAAGAAALRAIPAAAAYGQTITVGGVFSNPTTLNTAIAQSAVNGSVWAAYGTTGTLGFWGNVTSGRGVLGRSHGQYGYGVIGEANYGSGYFGTGVAGFANAAAGTGVFGFGAIGVYGRDAGGGNGTGVIGIGLGASLHRGVFGYSGSTDSYGVQGFGQATGVFGRTLAQNKTSVIGYTTATGSTGGYFGSIYGSGLTAYGGSTTGYGLFSIGATGVFGLGFGVGRPGLLGVALSGPALKLAGTGRIAQYQSLTGGIQGAPTWTPTNRYFELVRDSYGTMWANRPTLAGFSGQHAWKRINAVRVDTDDGTGAAYKPLRLADTRFGTGGHTGPFATNTDVTYTVAGAGSGAQKIPSTAVAVIGNLTATSFGSAGGFLAIHPAGVAFNPASDPSSLNFSGSAGAWANAFVCGLGTGGFGGQLTVHVTTYGGTKTNFIIDITGYIE